MAEPQSSDVSSVQPSGTVAARKHEARGLRANVSRERSTGPIVVTGLAWGLRFAGLVWARFSEFDLRDGGVLPTVAPFLTELLLILVFLEGIYSGSAFSRRLAILWQIEVVALGIYNMVHNRYPWAWVWELREGPLLFGFIPIVTGTVALVALMVLEVRAARRSHSSDGVA